MQAGALFGIYPEGTRSPDGRLYRGRTGIGWLALNSGLPVIPVAMIGTDRVLPPGSTIPRLSRIKVSVGEPLTFAAMRSIQALSGQEYVPVYASVRKEELAAAKNGHKKN
jgi:1-acyl-sn-glycerol-3-phosphate acyltransferase